MKFISKLLLRMAHWLSPPTVATFSLTMQFPNLSDLTQLQELSTALASLSNMEPSSTDSTEPSQTPEQLAAEPSQTPEQLVAEPPQTPEQLAVEQRMLILDLDAAEQHHRSVCVFWKSMNLPHRIYHADLLHDGASWVAKVGNEEGEALVVGRGTCPADALEDFDKQWLGMK